MPFGHFAALSGSLAVSRPQRQRGRSRRAPLENPGAPRRPALIQPNNQFFHRLSAECSQGAENLLTGDPRWPFKRASPPQLPANLRGEG